MNRNVESHFSLLPSAEISRSRFDRSQDIKTTFNVGQLIPFFIDEVLPGDTFDVTTSKVVRLQTLLTPIMDNMYLDTYFFFVPNRLVWTHWRELMGENTQSAWLPEVEYSVPQIVLRPAASGEHGSGKVVVGDILDYMGVPTNVQASDATDNTCSVSALPYRAYCKVFNDWFRDENLTDPVNFNTGDADQDYYTLQDNGLVKPFLASKYHDYFTSCLPSPQKGPQVLVPFSDTGLQSFYPVFSTQASHGTDTGASSVYFARPLHGTYRNTAASGLPDVLGSVAHDGAVESSDTTQYSNLGLRYPAAVDSGSFGFYPDNLYARIRFEDSHAGIDINDLRYAVQLQRLYERDARGGTRYIELIKSHFGVDSPDARLQRSEYLGGNRVALSVHQITNQSQGEQDFLGDLGAMSLTTDKNSDFTKSFTEHGFILGLCVVRYDHSYPQGLERFWRRKQRFDFYWPVFANLGEQAVLKSEIAWNPQVQDAVFGYQERWAEYRYKPNRVSAEMRPHVANTLDSWHLADYYAVVPSLSDSWIREDKSNVDRVLAVTSAVSNQIFADIFVQNYTTRPMPLYSIPGLLDHH